MGYERVELTITAQLSRHNDPERDPVDNAKWEELRDKVEAVVKEYEGSINAFIPHARDCPGEEAGRLTS